ncbi:hypothetical protein B0A48_03676 [Cryoendolithus antarcticus]|uniref:Uncharacterized protein n=1 Tax=Cryoendolithus antarcticus TaxID=1507870 RepID=A0A1V8TG79_9PEZI|nr:hypothetical protein B0A48_03676 [Cryoendolithus antarcticus]
MSNQDKSEAISHVIKALLDPQNAEALVLFVNAADEKERQQIFIDIIRELEPDLLDRLSRPKNLVYNVKQYLGCYAYLQHVEDPSDTHLPAAARRFQRFIADGDTDLRNALLFVRLHAEPITPTSTGLPWPDQPLLSDVLDLFTFANLSDPMLTTTLRVIMALKPEVQVTNAYKTPIVEQLATELLGEELTSFLRDTSAKHLLIPVRLNKSHWLLCHLTKHLHAELDIHIMDTRTLRQSGDQATPPEIISTASAIQLVAVSAGDDFDFGFAAIVLAATRLAPALITQWERGHETGSSIIQQLHKGRLELMLFGQEFNAELPHYRRNVLQTTQVPAFSLPTRLKAPEIERGTLKAAAKQQLPHRKPEAPHTGVGTPRLAAEQQLPHHRPATPPLPQLKSVGPRAQPNSTKRFTTPSPQRQNKKPHCEQLSRSKSERLDVAARKTPRTRSHPLPAHPDDLQVKNQRTETSARAAVHHAARDAARDRVVPETPAAYEPAAPPAAVTSAVGRKSLPEYSQLFEFNSSPPTAAIGHLPSSPPLLGPIGLPPPKLHFEAAEPADDLLDISGVEGHNNDDLHGIRCEKNEPAAALPNLPDFPNVLLFNSSPPVAAALLQDLPELPILTAEAADPDEIVVRIPQHLKALLGRRDQFDDLPFEAVNDAAPQIAPRSSVTAIPIGASPEEIAVVEREYLLEHCYTEEQLTLGNAMFGPGSDGLIILQTLLHECETARKTIARWERRTVHAEVELIPGTHELCRPMSAIRIVPSTMNIKLLQPLRNGRKYLCYTPYRYVAVFSLPIEDLWMAIICDRDNRALCDASARCNEYTGKDHCLTRSHLVIETRLINRSLRKQHHKGKIGCWCVQRCLGWLVKYQERTEADDRSDAEKLAG